MVAHTYRVHVYTLERVLILYLFFVCFQALILPKTLVRRSNAVATRCVWLRIIRLPLVSARGELGKEHTHTHMNTHTHTHTNTHMRSFKQALKFAFRCFREKGTNETRMTVD